MELRKLLYVEDDLISQDVIMLLLKGLFEIDTVNNGSEAIEAVKLKRYDAILMDINLRSKPNGMDVAKTIREMPEYRDAPVIAVTAYAQKKERDLFLSNGCTHYISKPFTKEGLIDIIKQALGDS